MYVLAEVTVQRYPELPLKEREERGQGAFDASGGVSLQERLCSSPRLVNSVQPLKTEDRRHRKSTEGGW